MSVTLMAAAWELDISSTDKLVLLALADWSNATGACWPSMKQLASKSGLTDRAIRTSIGRLCEAGHLTRDEVRGKGVNYVVHPGTSFRPAQDSPRNEMPKTPEPGSPNTLVTIIPQKATPSSGKRAPKRKTLVPSNFHPIVKPGSITAKAMDAWPPGTLDEEVEKFIDRHTAEQTLSACWQASWRTWVKNWKKFNGQRANSLGGNRGQSATGFGTTVDAATGWLAGRSAAANC